MCYVIITLDICFFSEQSDNKPFFYSHFCTVCSGLVKVADLVGSLIM